MNNTIFIDQNKQENKKDIIKKKLMNHLLTIQENTTFLQSQKKKHLTSIIY